MISLHQQAARVRYAHAGRAPSGSGPITRVLGPGWSARECGGTGRRAGFKSRCPTGVRVRLPPLLPRLAGRAEWEGGRPDEGTRRRPPGSAPVDSCDNSGRVPLSVSAPRESSSLIVHDKALRVAASASSTASRRNYGHHPLNKYRADCWTAVSGAGAFEAANANPCVPNKNRTIACRAQREPTFLTHAAGRVGSALARAAVPFGADRGGGAGGWRGCGGGWFGGRRATGRRSTSLRLAISTPEGAPAGVEEGCA